MQTQFAERPSAQQASSMVDGWWVTPISTPSKSSGTDTTLSGRSSVLQLRAGPSGTPFESELLVTENNFDDHDHFESDSIEGDDEMPPIDKLESTIDDRMRLLALKFEGQASIEDRARIHLLTVRLRRLDPRVTELEKRAAEEVVTNLERASDRLAAIKAKFNLK